MMLEDGQARVAEIGFDPAEYYASYPARIILRPGYPARASYKSTLLFRDFGEYIFRELGEIKDYADIGGCFGFGANAMAFHICQHQGYYPKTSVFEISPEFVTMGKLLFPHIHFVEGQIECLNGNTKVFDLVTLFDVVEHVPSPGVFLKALSRRAKFILLKTPMETSGEWRGSRPPARQGKHHADGHVNFFDPSTYMKLLRDSGFQIVKWRLVRSVASPWAQDVLAPESLVLRQRRPLSGLKTLAKVILSNPLLPYRFARKILGRGDHLCLVRSKKIGNRPPSTNLLGSLAPARGAKSPKGER